MATFVKFHQLAEDLGKAVHNFGSHQLRVALTNLAPNVSTAAVLADITEISYANCSSRAITTTSYEQTAGVARLILQDLTLTATGGPVGPFRYVPIFNDTPTSPADPLLGYLDYGASITLADGESIVIDFDGINGILAVS